MALRDCCKCKLLQWVLAEPVFVRYLVQICACRTAFVRVVTWVCVFKGNFTNNAFVRSITSCGDLKKILFGIAKGEGWIIHPRDPLAAGYVREGNGRGILHTERQVIRALSKLSLAVTSTRQREYL